MPSKALIAYGLGWMTLVGCGASGPDAPAPSAGTTSTGGHSAAAGSGTTNGGTTNGGTTNGGTTNGGTTNGGTTTEVGGSSAGGSAGTGVAGAASTSGAGGAGASGAAGTGGNATAGAGGSGPRFHVFLLLGQSNMAGWPKALDADKVADERIRVLGYDDCAATGRRQNTWAVAVPPLHECWNGAIGPGDTFAKTLIGRVPAGDTIGLVPCAISGERIETFMKAGGTRYDWILQRARLAQQAGGVIEGILFHQGESNNGDSSWPGKVNTLVTDLRTDLALGSAPLLAGELAHGGNCALHNTQVNRLPATVANAHVVSASGLAVDPADTQWNVHFGRDAQITFGARYAQKLIEVLRW